MSVLLNKRIAIERKAVTRDAMGGEIIAWTLLATVWANVQDELPSKSEAIASGIALASSRTRIRYHYRSDVTPDMRIVLRGATDRVFQIVGGPAELGQREYSEVFCDTQSTAPA